MPTMSRTGSFAVNPGTGELILSREAYPIFGFDSHGDPPTCPMVVARIHPDDRDRVGETSERAFRDGTSLEGEYRVLLPGGDIKHLLYVGHQVIHALGAACEYVGTLLDVTSQRAAEAQLDVTSSQARSLAASLMLTAGRHRAPGELSLAKLTPRERQIIQLVAEARSTKQIAFELGIGAKTVEVHRTHIMKKLGLHSASELVRYAIVNGIVKL